jgi:hypothetical protein
VVVVDVAWDGAAEAASAGGEERGAKGAVLIGGKPSSAKEAIAVDQIGGEIRDANASGWNWNGIEFLFLGGCKKWVKKKDREREREGLGVVAGSVK